MSEQTRGALILAGITLVVASAMVESWGLGDGRGYYRGYDAGYALAVASTTREMLVFNNGAAFVCTTGAPVRCNRVEFKP